MKQQHQPLPARRSKPVSAVMVGLLIVILVMLSLGVSFSVGARSTDLGEVWQALPHAWAYLLVPEAAEAMPHDDIVLLLALQRIPRSLLALIAGVCLGTAGALMQGFTRNPLADPGILGVGAGASAAVAIGVALGLIDDSSAYTIPAMIGALLVTILLFALSSRGSISSSPLSFVLAGMALSALLSAVVNALVLADFTVLDALRHWATGSVAGRDFGVVGIVIGPTMLFLILGLLLGPGLNLLALGEETAHSLGLAVRRQQTLGICAIAGLSAMAVSAAGPVAFIGLAGPHMVRAFVGTDYKRVLPLSGLVGGFLALWADIVGRVIAAPGELPMGIVLAIFGVPMFIWLVLRGRIGGNL